MLGQSIAVYALLALVGALAVVLAVRMRRSERALLAKERELRRLNLLYAALGHINQAIVRLRERDALLQAVCEVLVKQGPFRMAWIGWHDPATQTLVPIAQSGDETGYLDGLHISTADEPSGRGPSGTAFREDRLFVSNDTLNDAATRPWRARILASGHRASAVLPIRAAGVMQGTLQVYAGEPNFFQPAELALLTEAAADISFALDAIVEAERRREADSVAARERQFASNLVEAMPGIIYLYDEAGRFLRWNRDFERVSQFSGDEIAAMHPIEFFVEEDAALLTRKIAEVFEHGEARVEAAFRSKDGTATPYLFTGRHIHFDGKSCLIGVGVDLSDRVQAEEALSKSETRYRSTLDNILEGCQLLDGDLRYLYLNQAAQTQNRRPNSELLGTRMTDAWPGIESTPVFALIRRCREETLALHEEVEFHFADGTSGWFDLRVRPVPEGIFLLSIDVTERRRAEHALRELNATLELNVAARTQELATALVRAESADKLKSSFLATMSHELRTPLNSIIGFTGIILQGLAGPLNAEQTKQLGMVQGSARHLLALINDVLDISKIEADQLQIHLQPMDLVASVARVVATVKPQALARGLELISQLPSEPVLIRSDARRVEQVLLNLVNNAIKFTDRGTVTVTVSGTRVRVDDTGIGIAQHDIDKLFLPFRQLDSGLERRHEGTGLGLAISRRLTALLGGAIEVESVPGRGSTFTLVLPQTPDEHP